MSIAPTEDPQPASPDEHPDVVPSLDPDAPMADPQTKPAPPTPEPGER